MTEKQIILIVDDTTENIDILKGSLNSYYTIRIACNGEIAIRAANVRPYPDLILLDIMMPEMDGYEVCRRLKENPITKDIPIIFVTAKFELEDELAGLGFGAVDYITKPFRVPIVQARIKTHLALRAATRKLDEQNHVLRQEREFIENIILKMRYADTLDERYLRYLISPVEVTAGDMLLAVFPSDGRQLVLLGDFTGHGLSAAIGGPLVTYIFYELAKRECSGEFILSEINRQLCLRLPTGIFFSATLIEISQDRQQATLWNAGLPDTLLVRNHRIKSHIPSSTFPLGISENMDISGAATTLTLEQGDLLYIFSDGIIEAKDKKNTMFGMERLEPFIEKVATGNRKLDDLATLLNEHVGSSAHEDDITIVEIQA